MRISTLKSPEGLAAVGMVVSLLLAGAASIVPILSFGDFYHMAAVLLASDVVLYLLLKARTIAKPRDPTR